jgi:hypothetical protein
MNTRRDAGMSRTFNFRQSRELLRVDPKTFQKWLQKAGIDPAKQVNLADSRERYLTQEQLTLLAKQHGRTLPPLDSQPELPATVTAAMLAEQLALLEQEITQHFKRLEAQGLQILQIVADLQQHLSNLERTVPLQREHKPAVQKGGSASPSAPTSKIEHESSSTRTPTKNAKKRTKGKKLPRTLIPLHVFAREHGVSEGAADHAAQTGKITVECGKWLYNSRYITSALDQQGQREFYALFHGREGFRACGRCPDALSV